MRISTAVVAAVLALVGCTTRSTAGEGSPPLRHVTSGRLAEEPAHEHERALHQPSGRFDPGDPAAVAAALIVAGLTEQGLLVVDLGVEILAATPTTATVRVAAAHAAQMGGVPHTSVYDLDVIREAGGPWRLIDFRQAH